MRKSVSEEQVKNKEQVQSKPEAEKQKKSKAGLIFGIINSIFILALAGGGYFLLNVIEEKQVNQESDINKGDQREIESSQKMGTFQSQLDTMQSQIATFNQQLAGKDEHFTKTLDRFSQLHADNLGSTRKRLATEIAQVKRQLGKTRSDWLIADAEYLLSIANQRLHLVGDVNTARMAFEAADQRLRESGDTSVYKVREQITKEIAVLRGIKVPDAVGMHSSIQLLKDKVPKLAVRLPYAGKPLTESKQIHNHDEEQENDHGILNSVLHQLEGYVTVKHMDQQVTHILTEEEVGFIRQQLGVKFEIIKIALVQQNDAIYQASIKDAKQWVKDNFTINPQSIGVLEELGRLSTTHLRTNFPDVSKSLKMIKDITKLRIETDKQEEGVSESNEIKFEDKKIDIKPLKESQSSSTDKPKSASPVKPKQQSSSNQTDAVKTEPVSDKVKP